MKDMLRSTQAGLVAAGLLLSIGASTVFAQTNVQVPPSRENLPAYKGVNSTYTPGTIVDPLTGEGMGWSPIIEAVHIPYDGVFPAGTILQPEREAGRPMRPGIDPWIPDGSGYWAPLFDDLESPQSQPLMQNFEGPGPNGLSPPDPDLARGYDYEVLATNDDFAVYDSCGNELFRRDINDYLGISDFMFDPKVIFDPWAGRWVMMYHIRVDNQEKSRLVFVITGNSTPFGLPGSNVWYYNFNVVQDAGTGNASWADYFDLGYSNTQLSASGNMFKFAGGFRWARIMVFDKAAMYAAGSAGFIWWHGLTNADGSTTTTPRAVKMQTSWSESGNIDAYFVNSRGGGGNRITFWKVRGAFGSNTLTKVDTVVGNYTAPPDARQPNGSVLDTIDCRLMTAVATTDTLGNNGIDLFTGLTTERSGESGALLYKFNAVSHALEFESNFGADGFYYWFPSSAADYSGSNFWVFARTANSAGNEPEIRFVDMDQGVFSSSSAQIKDGTGSYTGFRWGDYFVGQMDWGDFSANNAIPGIPSKVWLYGEYGKSGNSWGTHDGATSVYPQGSISSVTPSTTWVISGPPGGPFSPSSRVYSLSSSSGDVGTAYEVLSLPSWLDASKTYDQIWTSSSVTLSVNSAANGLGLGTYTDTVVFDECYNNRGQFNRSVELRVQAPDLDVLSMAVVDGTYNPGDIISVSGQYKNNGNLATGTFTADFYASTNTIISPSDTLLGSRNYSSLGAGSTMNFGAHFLTLPCMAANDYYIGVIVTVTGDADTSDNVDLDRTPIGVEFCVGDFNEDCAVNTLDVIAFLNAWSAGDMSADCSGDGVINTLDVICFLNAWTSGC